MIFAELYKRDILRKAEKEKVELELRKEKQRERNNILHFQKVFLNFYTK